MNDAIVCGRCGSANYKRKENQGKSAAFCLDCGNLIRYLEPQVDLNTYVWPVGKYKGKTVAQIAFAEPAYFRWAEKNMSGELQRVAAQVLEERL